MTPPSAATERGHSMPDRAVKLPDGALVWECEDCGDRAIAYDGQEYGTALERDCRERAA